MCLYRHVLARRYNFCDRYNDDQGYAIVYNCVQRNYCNRGEPDEYGFCGDVLLPASDSFTSFYVCNNDCTTGPRLECPRRSESLLLRNAGITRSQWDAYIRRLYGVMSADHAVVLPRIDQVDMIYTGSQMLPINGVEYVDNYDTCPRTAAHAPIHLGQPHVNVAAYYAYAEAPTPAASHQWIEVTHCGSHIEAQSLWFYVQRGSGIFVNVGNTIVFDDHPAASEHFNAYGDITNVPAAARAAGYDSIQYTEHCEGCRCDFELMLTTAAGTAACPQGVEFRSGLNASRPCTCVQANIGSADRPACIACQSFAGLLV